MTTDPPATVLDAVRLLEAEGYTDSFTVRGDGVSCARCGQVHEGAELDVERVYRFEGPSDPSEEAIVMGLHCVRCDARGTLVSAYGPGADPEVLDRLVMLDTRFRDSGA